MGTSTGSNSAPLSDSCPDPSVRRSWWCTTRQRATSRTSVSRSRMVRPQHRPGLDVVKAAHAGHDVAYGLLVAVMFNVSALNGPPNSTRTTWCARPSSSWPQRKWRRRASRTARTGRVSRRRPARSSTPVSRSLAGVLGPQRQRTAVRFRGQARDCGHDHRLAHHRCRLVRRRSILVRVAQVRVPAAIELEALGR